jgi:putative transposase
MTTLFTKAVRRHSMPETSTIDGRQANAAAIRRDNEVHGTATIIGQVKYLPNVVEQDRRGVNRGTCPMLGFTWFEAAQSTLVGVELMPIPSQSFLHLRSKFATKPASIEQDLEADLQLSTAE